MKTLLDTFLRTLFDDIGEKIVKKCLCFLRTSSCTWWCRHCHQLWLRRLSHRMLVSRAHVHADVISLNPRHVDNFALNLENIDFVILSSLDKSFDSWRSVAGCDRRKAKQPSFPKFKSWPSGVVWLGDCHGVGVRAGSRVGFDVCQFCLFEYEFLWFRDKSLQGSKQTNGQNGEQRLSSDRQRKNKRPNRQNQTVPRKNSKCCTSDDIRHWRHNNTYTESFFQFSAVWFWKARKFKFWLFCHKKIVSHFLKPQFYDLLFCFQPLKPQIPNCNFLKLSFKR